MEFSAIHKATNSLADSHGCVHFSFCAENARCAHVCLFDSPTGVTETRRIPMSRDARGTWGVDVAGIAAGRLYGFRVDGPYAPADGHRFNPAKLLIDPRARRITGPRIWHGSLRGYRADTPDDSEPDRSDSAPHAPKCVVVDPSFDWRGDAPPRISWDQTVIYECHVKGLTRLHPGVPPELRGTYLGLSFPPIIEHLLALGVTAVELLPVHASFDEERLVRSGLTNYWGYNTLNFFSPDERFATPGGDPVREFKSMVRALHAAGIEVILDVVYNHSCEGNHLGPTVSYRGIENATFYHLNPADRRRYADFTGCGNTLNASNPIVRDLILDSLHYWIEEMHVDGFRLDLAPALERGRGGIDPSFSLFTRIPKDPVLAGVKLIVEPWDAAADGMCLGRFPDGIVEWNSRFRDTARRFWRGDAGQLGELASRLAGSSDLFAGRSGGPLAGINFVTCHDGFTLHDVTAHEKKQNAANGEDNRDGSNENFSRNWGTEGPANDRSTLDLRERAARNLLATLALSQGVPMILSGDEIGRTQQGNNNAYAQDNEISWLDWRLDSFRRARLEFVRKVLWIRRRYPMLRRSGFLSGETAAGAGLRDVAWFRSDGAEMSHADWTNPASSALAMMLHDSSPEANAGRSGNAGITMILLMNGGGDRVRFHRPNEVPKGDWTQWPDTYSPVDSETPERIDFDEVWLEPYSMKLLIGEPA